MHHPVTVGDGGSNPPGCATSNTPTAITIQGKTDGCGFESRRAERPIAQLDRASVIKNMGCCFTGRSVNGRLTVSKTVNLRSIRSRPAIFGGTLPPLLRLSGNRRGPFSNWPDSGICKSTDVVGWNPTVATISPTPGKHWARGSTSQPIPVRIGRTSVGRSIGFPSQRPM